MKGALRPLKAPFNFLENKNTELRDMDMPQHVSGNSFIIASILYKFFVLVLIHVHLM